ncbi:MAG: TrkH family potassium uptake protein [Clostridia bacterium]|nr:TrkH family potassium uptake protein [Clostridia bacterium]
MILHVLGEIFIVEALLMLLPCITSLIYHETVLGAYLISVLITAAVGLVFVLRPVTDKRIYHRDGFAIVSIGWTAMSIFGALPFIFSGEIPFFLDAVFESVSGFTTTGASILTDVEHLSHASLLWRSLTHWVGGMGVLAFLMVLIPVTGGGGNLNLMRAESPGVEVEKLVPKANSTARILYGIYIFGTLLLFGLLVLGRMPVFDAVNITFATAGTGGFAVLNSSMASYSPYIQAVVTVFMVLFGINFNLYFLILCRRFRDALRSEELRAYLILFVSAVLFVTLDVYLDGIYATFGESFRHSAFQVASLMSTTGFASADFDKWPEVARVVLVGVMCIGSCASSTAGGLKVSRVLLAVKSAGLEVKRVLNPHSVNVVTLEGKRVKSEVVKTTFAYIVIYIMIFAISLLVVSFDRMDFTTNVTGVLATLNNVGPGLSAVGPTGNFSAFSPLSKLVFIADMLLGRLEIFPFLVLFTSLFRRK